MPKDASKGNHTLRVDAMFHLSSDVYQSSVTKSSSINVQGNCAAEESNLAITTELLNTPYSEGEQFTIKLNLFNTGNKKATYMITASGYDAWARLDKIDPVTIALEPSETASAYLYLTTLNVSGSKSLRVRVAYGDKRVDKDIYVEVKERVTTNKAYQGFVTRLSNLSGLDLVTVNIILVIAIILIILWIIRVRRSY